MSPGYGGLTKTMEETLTTPQNEVASFNMFALTQSAYSLETSAASLSLVSLARCHVINGISVYFFRSV